MSSGSSGDIGGEVSGEEAAWRDLIARFDSPGDLSVSVPWPASEDLPDTADPGTATPASTPDDCVAETDHAAGTESAAEPARVIRPAAGPRSYSPPAADPRSYSPPEEEDGPYVPTPLPPPARLDGLAKAAWAGLICGPGYLLIGTMLGWTISGTEALIAVAAFVAGFVILVVRMGDRPPRDDNDDGAVV